MFALQTILFFALMLLDAPFFIESRYLLIEDLLFLFTRVFSEAAPPMNPA